MLCGYGRMRHPLILTRTNETVLPNSNTLISIHNLVKVWITHNETFLSAFGADSRLAA